MKARISRTPQMHHPPMASGEKRALRAVTTVVPAHQTDVNRLKLFHPGWQRLVEMLLVTGAQRNVFLRN